ncbi:DUF58 domain-containing protein [Anaerolinea sp.]|uniref:DUF58 domain-containing protein n=1 Tax=Anaerolinea sp. TaxID=1872519 RepID=UPI00261289B5|nr:DUF58 domain-containing protein [uncultured Anaerolinea sp.]
MNSRTAFLLLLIFGFLITGLISLNGAVIALAIPLLVYLGIAVWYSPTPPHLVAFRTLPLETVFPDTPVEVNIFLKNNGGDLPEVLIEDNVPEGLTVLDGETSRFLPLPAGEEIRLSYVVKGGRGDYRFNSLQVSYREGAGLFEGKIAVQASHRLMVRPRPRPLRSIPIRPPQTRGFAGPIPSRQGGVGIDFFLVREYQPGDPMRRINWKVTAREEQNLFTNLFEQQRVADVGIILDAREQSYGGSNDHLLFEHAVDATASIADAFLRDGNRVGMLVYGAGIDTAFPGAGKIQHQRILQVLARAHLGSNYALESLSYLPTRFFPPHSQVVLISPLQPHDTEILITLRAHGYQVLVLSPDLIRFDAGQVAPNSPEELALRIALAERKFALQKLRRAGIQVLDWDVTLPLEQVVRQAIPLRPHLRRGMGVPV